MKGRSIVGCDYVSGSITEGHRYKYKILGDVCVLGLSMVIDEVRAYDENMLRYSDYIAVFKVEI